MKTILTLAVCLIVSAGDATAADIEARLLRFSGEIPSVATLLSLLESNSIANPTKLSAALNEKNAFEYRAITPNEFPTSFDANGKPDATDKRDTGIIFSGDATVSDGTYNLNIAFSLVERTNTILYPTKTGTTIAQPVFRSKDVKTAITANAGDWFLVQTSRQRQSGHFRGLRPSCVARKNSQMTATLTKRCRRTRSAVTVAASGLRCSPSVQPPRQLRASLSLGSLAYEQRHF